MKNNVLRIVSVVAPIVWVAVLGSVFVNLGMDWYATLIKPSIFIPDFIIPIMWSIIYISFTIVLCLWVSKGGIPIKTIVLLIINGILNILWCLLFFTLNNTLLGVISIVLLLIMSYFLVVNISKFKNLYFYMTAIYPIWVSLATTLNLSLWILN